MTYHVGPRTIKDVYESLPDSRKAWAKMFLNSVYGTPSKRRTRLTLCFARRDDLEKASLWVRLFGERTKKTDLAYLRTAYPSTKSVRITKTGQKELRRLTKKLSTYYDI